MIKKEWNVRIIRIFYGDIFIIFDLHERKAEGTNKKKQYSEEEEFWDIIKRLKIWERKKK